MAEASKKARTKTPRKITESTLRNIALYYLQRYASSSENLKRVLMRRVHRAAQFHEMDISESEIWVDQLVQRLVHTGVVDDQAYAEGRMRALFRRGASPRTIAQRLKEKGVDDDLIEQTLSTLRDETSDPNLLAAIKLAKRRRLGPYQTEQRRTDRKDKDLAALARAGFDYQTALKVIDAPSVEDIEQMAYELSKD